MTVEPSAEHEQRQSRRTSWLREILETVVLTIAIFLAVRVALQNFRVEGTSMMPNLHNGEYILVNRVDYMLHSPHRGDVIVFHAVPAGQPDKDFIKRVIGVPGDVVQVKNHEVFVDHHVLHESYIGAGYRPQYTFGPVKVPPSDYFVLGDNRNDSYDSSRWATPWLSRSDIIGKAWISYWPLSNFGFIPTPSFTSR